ncbi:MAG: serine hydrolase [Bacteroidia bacterium]|nr:serine hydrolase [Bacteroidia bacterium]
MRQKLPILITFVLGIAFVLLATLYSSGPQDGYSPAPFLSEKTRWADSLLRKMTLPEKIGQLILVVAEPDTTERDHPLTTFLTDYHLGGIVFRGYDATQQWQRTNIYQQVSSKPLLVGMYSDPSQEDLARLPADLSLAAIDNDSLVRKMSQNLARQSNDLGVHLYFTPIVAEGHKPENRNQIVSKVLTFSEELQHRWVLSVPGYARTYFPFETDSILLDSLLSPYDTLSKKGISGFFIGGEELDLVKINSAKDDIIRNYLFEHILFKGLLVAETSGESEDQVEDRIKKAIKAGADLLVVQKKYVPQTYEVLKTLIGRDKLLEEKLNEKVRRILLAKSWAHAPDFYAQADFRRPLPFNPYINRLVNRQLAEATLTLARDDHGLIPFRQLREKRFHLLTIGEESIDFLNQLRWYAPFSSSRLARKNGGALPRLDVRFFSDYNPLIVVFKDEIPEPERDTLFIQTLAQIQARTEVVFVHLGEVERLKDLPETNTLVHAYGQTHHTEQLAAQLLFGGVSSRGRIPLHINDTLSYRQGLTRPVVRLAYTIPEEAGMSSAILAQIDSIVYEGIGSFAMPGCQVFVAKGGKVVYHKSFGHPTYASPVWVNLTDLYDIASVTKVAATTVAAMYLTDKKRISPYDPLGKFFKDQIIITDSVVRRDTLFIVDSLFLASTSEPYAETDTSESPFILVAQRQPDPSTRIDTFRKGDSLMVVKSYLRGKMRMRSRLFSLTLAELLSHHSGLPAGLSILPYMRYRNKFVGRYDRYFRPAPDSQHTVEVAANFYLRNDYRDSLWKTTKGMGINPKKTYEYSDANMILVQMAIDSLNQEPISSFLAREIYEPLGMQNARFNPRTTLDPERMIPTEYDEHWRSQLLKGSVHDPTAALLGGIAGNAGLFSNANDLGILLQMVLNGGTYGGEKYMDAETVELFTHTYKGTRGLGFDKPPFSGEYIIGSRASKKSYGHTGFTGTCVWVDPESELVYVFLSNRVHPKSSNWKLNTLRIRQRIHDVIYEAMDADLQTSL